MDSRDFLFPLNRIVSLTSSSFLVAKVQPETVWYLFTPATKERFTTQRRSTLTPNRETKGNLRPAIVGLAHYFTSTKEIRGSLKEVRVKLWKMFCNK